MYFVTCFFLFNIMFGRFVHTHVYSCSTFTFTTIVSVTYTTIYLPISFNGQLHVALTNNANMNMLGYLTQCTLPGVSLGYKHSGSELLGLRLGISKVVKPSHTSIRRV